MKLLIATNNPGKVREYQQIFRELLPEVELVTLAEAGVDHEVEETGESFEANARLKAETYSQLSGLPVIADDSGLEVDALGGFPGIHSARWAGPGDADRRAALLAKLEGVPPEKRGARFVCVSVFREPGGQEVVGRGEVEGRIALEPRGEGGFGYDPLFLLPERGVTMAELPAEEKNRLSHRGRAAQAIVVEVGQMLRK